MFDNILRYDIYILNTKSQEVRMIHYIYTETEIYSDTLKAIFIGK